MALGTGGTGGKSEDIWWAYGEWQETDAEQPTSTGLRGQKVMIPTVFTSNGCEHFQTGLKQDILTLYHPV